MKKLMGISNGREAGGIKIKRIERPVKIRLPLIGWIDGDARTCNKTAMNIIPKQRGEILWRTMNSHEGHVNYYIYFYTRYSFAAFTKRRIASPCHNERA